MTTDRHVTPAIGIVAALYLPGILRANAATRETRARFMRMLNGDAAIDEVVARELREAADAIEAVVYGERCTCGQSWTARHAPGCLLSENVRGWDDTRATESELRVMDGNR